MLIPDWANRPFRIVYLLHGLHGNSATWLDKSMLSEYAKNDNTVFIMPEAGRSFYTNQKYGRRYFDFFNEELPCKCQKIFSISAKREDTAVMGYSMGGYGALRLSLSNPESFGFCGAISPACLYFKPILDKLREDPSPYLKTGPEANEVFKDLRCIYGDGLEYREDYDVVKLAKNFPADKPKPKFYVTCGTEDDLRKENLEFTKMMAGTDFDYTYEEWPGGHEWIFFNEALRKTLEVWRKQ